MSSLQEQLYKCVNSYKATIDQNPLVKIIDIFSTALVGIAVVQCLFMIIIRDTFPFNAFLAGFIICVTQFVLNVSLRLALFKYGGDNKVRGERKVFVEYVVCSLILHFISLHFIN